MLRADGRECQAWAVRDSDPPICSSHDGRTVGAGAPKNNQNRVVHGFYGRSLSPEEVADLVAHAMDMTLDDELSAARVAMRRVMVKLKEEMLPDDLGKLAGLIFMGANTIARILRTKRIISGDSADSLSSAFAFILQEVGEELELTL